ncbi:hypothetical protein C0J08_18075 [Marinomonas sp. CT5]|uniref:hypothetical protein n=1 Tax=Marinomonas sp. CT5 TaxID=2066133 RepID=UPI0017CEA513|nr:hypothetical protein [Marinomonas sp. CT5]NVK72743.1 hypothetical protein [Oceanospirillaceae bacterium]QUX97179.1 hypothetical protein C0J08_18075 [Marinomonas sp. CT5]
MSKLPFIFVVMLLSSLVWAESRGFDLELGPHISSINYSETGGVSQQGRSSGINARYSAYYPFAVILIDLSHASGGMDYKGAGEIKGIKAEMYELRSMLGRAFYMNNSYRLTPYLGFGYRRSTVDSSDDISSTSIAGYKSQQTYFYNPIGIEIQQLMGENTWVVGGRFEFDNLLMSNNETRLGESSMYKTVDLAQKEGRGYRFYLNFRQFLDDNGSGVVIEPFYKYWEVVGSSLKSTSNANIKHDSEEWGVALMLSF